MTSSVVLASNSADSAAVDTIIQHHAELVGTVIAHTTALLDASAAGNIQGASDARRQLVLFCRGDLLPHAVAEEDSLYELARSLPKARMLVDAMVAEHRVLAELVDDLTEATTPLAASAAAHALRVLFELHADKENEFILPALAEDPSVSLAGALGQMHENFEELRTAAQGAGGCGSGGCGCGGHGAGDTSGGHGQTSGGCGCGGHGQTSGGCGCGGHGHGGDEAPAAGAGDGHGDAAGAPSSGCGCGGHDEPGRPVLDARAVPHNIRHATVFGALDAVRPGAGLELIAPHDPLPLLAQIEQRNPGAFEISYLERGPEAWRLALDRRTVRV